jgi:hypothetical protein
MKDKGESPWGEAVVRYLAPRREEERDRTHETTSAGKKTSTPCPAKASPSRNASSTLPADFEPGRAVPGQDRKVCQAH